MSTNGRFLQACTVLLSTLTIASVFQVVVFATPQEKVIKSPQKQAEVTEPAPELSPRDKFIAQTYLSHAAQLPDQNESLEALQGYIDGINMLSQADGVDRAVIHFEALTNTFPDSRHAWEGLGVSLKRRFDSRGNQEDLRRYTDAFARAIEMGLAFGRIPTVDTEAAAVGLGKLGDIERLDSLFGKLIQHSPSNHVVALDYARGLAAAKNSKAEERFRKAMQIRPTGSYDSVLEFGEWLLDRQRYHDALDVLVLRPGEPMRYAHFLRGVAFEHLGAKGQAIKEYTAYRRLTADQPGIESFIPMPSKYRIPSSTLQHGIVFSDDVSIESHCTGHNNLAQALECEAGAETTGGRRAVGWVARNRVFIGTKGCVTVNNSGSTICAQYQSVLTEPNQFDLACGRSPSTSTIQVAYDVWYGVAPETSTGWCPSGEGYKSNACTSTCSTQASLGGLSVGDLQFYGTTGVCDPHHPYGPCTSPDYKLCGNGGSDNCFYYVP